MSLRLLSEKERPLAKVQQMCDIGAQLGRIRPDSERHRKGILPRGTVLEVACCMQRL